MTDSLSLSVCLSVCLPVTVSRIYLSQWVYRKLVQCTQFKFRATENFLLHFNIKNTIINHVLLSLWFTHVFQLSLFSWLMDILCSSSRKQFWSCQLSWFWVRSNSSLYESNYFDFSKTLADWTEITVPSDTYNHCCRSYRIPAMFPPLRPSECRWILLGHGWWIFPCGATLTCKLSS